MIQDGEVLLHGQVVKQHVQPTSMFLLENKSQNMRFATALLVTKKRDATTVAHISQRRIELQQRL